MFTSSTVVKSIAAIGSAVGAFVWVPDVAIAGRDFVSEPLRAEIVTMKGEIKTLMASGKHFDIRTDELSTDVRRLEIKVNSMDAYLKQHFNNTSLTADDVRNKTFLENQLHLDKKELDQKNQMLERANQEDALLLKALSQT
jgi:hypothetical protein